MTVLNIVFGATIDLTKIKFPIMKKGFVGDSIPFFSLEKDIVSMKNPVLGSMKTDGESEGKGSNGGKRSIGDTVMHTLFGVLTQPSSPSSPSTSPRAVAHVETEDEHKVSAEDKDESSAVTHSDVVVSFPTGPAVVTHPSSHSATTSTGAATSHAAANVTTTSSVVAGASTAAAPDLTPLAPGRVYRQSSPKPIDDLYPSLSISQVAIPLRLTGWMKKQGHFAKTWKMRYFVLDRGMLTYYVDESASPPYGTEMKGQLCLAGYREQSLISNSETAATTAAAGQQAIDLTNTSASEVFDEVSSALQIQLRYYPNIVSPEIVDELNKDFGRCAPEQSHKELLMVCQSVAVKEAWLAALEAHTIYIETIALKFKQDMENNKGGTSSKPGSRSPSPAPSPKNREDASYSIISALSSFSRRDGNNNITSGRPKVSRASRQASMTLSSQKWAIFLNRNEKMVLAGLVEKPNPVGYRYMRNLLLVKYETPEDGDQAPVACRKRLIYIDSNSYEKKGEILWLEDAKAVHPTVVAVSTLLLLFFSHELMLALCCYISQKDDYFDVTDANGKSSRFYPKDDLSVARWIAEINGLPPV